MFLYKSNTDCEIIVRKFAIQDDVGHDFLTFVVRAFSSDIENFEPYFTKQYHHAFASVVVSVSQNTDETEGCLPVHV